ncbi:MAG: YhcH/YjgK/YiaL family protein [Faecalibacterium sp.]|nr:YhcH/YjgK/YiaL family protein [Ruminococcus sp.]MCM1391846.1 YhcH/YjgK/YiaL family protein [Ruminococcus sp.]MCM1485710.1 YhcH/YjgK/YiaL family protein [Faecalibacterium sp.]
MIFDDIHNISDYFEQLPLLKKVEEFVQKFNAEKLSDGRYEIDGKRVFAMVQSYRSKPQTPDMMFEAHKKYIDVQYIANGIEKIRWAKLEKVDMVEERYTKGEDIAFYEGDAAFDFVLTKNTFLVLYPNDAHLPGLSADKDVNVRKIVFKILIEQ